MDPRPTSSRFRRWVNRFLGARHDYFCSYLPEDWGYSSFLAPILKSLFANVSLSSAQTAILKALPKNAIIVYVSKYKSNFEYLFYHIRYKAEGLPFPQLAFDYRIIVWQKLSRLARIVVAHLDHFLRTRKIPDPFQSGFYVRNLRAGRTGFLSLVDRKGFYDRFVKARHDPLALLIDLQRQTTRPIVIVPQWLLFSKKPLGNPLGLADIFFANAENPSPLRRWLTILQNPNKASVEISEPLNLQDFLREPGHGERPPEQLSFAVRRRLLDAMNRHRQSITGPVLKTREELKELVLRNDRFQAFLKSHAKNGKNTPAQLHKKADAALDEIAADYSPRFIRVLCMIFGWIWKTMFDGVVLDMDGLGRVKRAATRGPIIFVPCHRSHFDYLILPYLLVSNNMPCPHVAAGRNLAFWPMGPLIRKSGAFFIRRSFHGAKLYAKVFSEYVRVLVQQGFNIEFFIEGGRSRTGKMVLPKTGLLTILMDAYKQGACEDLIFAPVFVGYDRLLEEGALLSELEGRRKQEESLGQLFRVRKFLNKRHGRIYVQFDEPISFKNLTSQAETPLGDMDQTAYHALGRNLAYRIINAINRISVVTPQALVAAVILNYPKHSFACTDLMSCVEAYLHYLRFRNRRLSENLHHPPAAVQTVLDLYCSRKIIEKQEPKPGLETSWEAPRFAVPENKRLNLEYYKNNCIHHFIPAAYTAMAILSYDAFQFSASALHADYGFLQEMFKYEFAYDVGTKPEFVVRKTLKAFIDDAILMPHASLPDTYNITSAGFRKLLFFASFLKTYFESYWIVLHVLKAYGRREIVKKERMKKIRSLGAQLYKRKEIERREALSSINYENALTFFNFKGIRGKEDEQGIRLYHDIIQKYLGCFVVQK